MTLTNTPLTTVVVPCFNVSSFAGTLRSTLAQNIDAEVEFILVDDGSTDTTADLLQEMAAALPGVRLVMKTSNGGLASARNAGIEASSGRYLGFMDADDWLAPGYFRRLTDYAVRLDVDFIRCDHVTVTGFERRIVRSPEALRHRRLGPGTGILPIDGQSGVDYPYACAGLIDTERFGREDVIFDEGLHTCEDRPWIWRLYRRAESHAVVNEHGYFYQRGITQSLTQIGDARQLHFLDAFAILLGETLDRAAPEVEQKAVRSFCAILAHQINKRGRLDRSLQDELLLRGATMLRTLPPSIVLSTISAMGESRRNILSDLMEDKIRAL